MKIASVVTDLLIVIGQFGLAAVMFPAGIAAPQKRGREMLGISVARSSTWIR